MEKRVVIVDFNHMAHTFKYGAKPLSVSIVHDGQIEVVDTTVANGAIKNIYKWSNHGRNPMAICFDRRCSSRINYFRGLNGGDTSDDIQYKGKRNGLRDGLFEGITITESVLNAAGLSCMFSDNYEADDIIFACVQRAKQQYPDLKIDIITNDADIVPLVDDTVSVFLRSRQLSWAESDELLKNKYVQITPRNYQSVLEALSAYKGFKIPYNTVLLHKLLRGDKSDNIKGYPKFTPTKYNKLIESMQDAGEDLSVFRYGRSVVTFRDEAGKDISIDEARVVRSAGGKIFKKYSDSIELLQILDLLRKYGLDEDQLEHVQNIYRGINLNTHFSDRVPGVAPEFTGFDEVRLQQEADKLRIKLNIY